MPGADKPQFHLRQHTFYTGTRLITFVIVCRYSCFTLRFDSLA
jgi:hypothetical protein